MLYAQLPSNFPSFASPVSSLSQDSIRLWSGMDSSIDDEYSAMRGAMPSLLFSPLSESQQQDDANLVDPAHQSLTERDETPSELWTRQQLEIVALVREHAEALNARDHSAALDEISRRQSQLVGLVLKHSEEQEAMRERLGNVQRLAHVDLAASTMTIVPGPAAVFPPNPSPALAPVSLDDVDMLFDLELSDPTSVFYSPTGRLAPASTLEPPAFLLDSVEESPSTSSASSRSNSLWASSASSSSDWSSLLDFASQHDGHAGPPPEIALLASMTAVDDGSAVDDTSYAEDDHGAMSIVTHGFVPAEIDAYASRPMRRTSSGAKFERSRFSCDDCFRKKKRCIPHPRADGSIPQVGDCVHCVQEATKRNLRSPACTWTKRGENIVKARQTGSLKEDYHSVELPTRA